MNWRMIVGIAVTLPCYAAAMWYAACFILFGSEACCASDNALLRFMSLGGVGAVSMTGFLALLLVMSVEVGNE